MRLLVAYGRKIRDPEARVRAVPSWWDSKRVRQRPAGLVLVLSSADREEVSKSIRMFLAASLIVNTDSIYSRNLSNEIANFLANNCSFVTRGLRVAWCIG